MSAAEEVLELFEARGHKAYFGESVSILEHSLQTAWLATESGAEKHLVVAALLHDLGHLIHGMPEDIADLGMDARHEIAAEAWLRSRFVPQITGPVRLHVDAKRYLCYTDAEYLAQLSPSSIQSLKLQGGAFTPGEARAFERNAYFRGAILLRRWDDAAKIPGLEVPGLRFYREALYQTESSPYGTDNRYCFPLP